VKNVALKQILSEFDEGCNSTDRSSRQHSHRIIIKIEKKK